VVVDVGVGSVVIIGSVVVLVDSVLVVVDVGSEVIIGSVVVEVVV